MKKLEKMGEEITEKNEKNDYEKNENENKSMKINEFFIKIN